MPNTLDPDRMTAAERLDEVAAILAAGVLRLREKANKPNAFGDVSLDFNGRQSVHGRATNEYGD